MQTSTHPEPTNLPGAANLLASTRAGDGDSPLQLRTTAVSPVDTAAVGRIALDEAIRTFEDQGRRIESVRTRATTIIGVAGVGATFVASRAAGLTGTALLVTSASVIVFAATIAVGLWAISPTKKFQFGLASLSILRDWQNYEMDLGTMYEQVCKSYEEFYAQNEKPLTDLKRTLVASVLLLILGLGVLVVGMLLSL